MIVHTHRLATCVAIRRVYAYLGTAGSRSVFSLDGRVRRRECVLRGGQATPFCELLYHLAEWRLQDHALAKLLFELYGRPVSVQLG